MASFCLHLDPFVSRLLLPVMPQTRSKFHSGVVNLEAHCCLTPKAYAPTPALSVIRGLVCPSVTTELRGALGPAVTAPSIPACIPRVRDNMEKADQTCIRGASPGSVSPLWLRHGFDRLHFRTFFFSARCRGQWRPRLCCMDRRQE